MRLLIDAMCGGIVSYLRMCGHDAVYAGDRGLEEADAVLAAGRTENRTVITRNVSLAGRADDAILLESRDVEEQLRELAAAGVDLTIATEPRRCGRCNGSLDPVDRTEPTPEYAPDPAETEVWRCRDCGQYFWKGSHWDRVRETLAALDRNDEESGDR